MNTRKWDILQLLENYKHATCAYERDMAERSLRRIHSESKEVEKLREKLIMAVRNDDKSAMSRFQHELMMIRADETYGKDY